MKAAVCREVGNPLVIEDVHLAPPGAGEVRVKLAASAICHSDVIFIDGGWEASLPAVFGHEASGVVEAVGEGVSNVVPGDHVVVTLIRSCGHCHYCEMNAPTACETEFPLDEDSPLSAADGAPITHGLRTGAFAEAVVVEHSQVVAIPKDVSLESASLLACGVITGFGAVTNTAKVPAGASVVVIGAGGVGLNSIQGAAHVGASPIIAVDLTDEKCETSRVFGATHGINGTTADAVQAVRNLTDGRGADYVFVTVGAKPAFSQAFQMIGKTGAVVLVGMPPDGVTTEIDPGTIANDSQRVLGSKMGQARIAEDIPHLVSLYKSGQLKLDELITGRFPLGDINDALQGVRDGTSIRNVIVFGETQT